MAPRVRSRRPSTRAEAVALPKGLFGLEGRGRALLSKLVPSRHSLAVGFGILVLAVGAYFVARESSLFALDKVDVQGGSAQVDAQVRQALAPFLGRNLIGLDESAVVRSVEALPTVVSATYDRAFPHTLRISIVPEQQAAVLRAGASSWLVSARGRVMAKLGGSTSGGALPRIWLGAAKSVALGSFLSASSGGDAARALGAAGAFRSRVGTASLVGGVLTFHLRSGIELLLGTAGDVPLKVAVAERALRVLPAGTRFLDVSVPGRPVAGSTIPVSTSATKTSSRGRG